jgi:hypothetical protein
MISFGQDLAPVLLVIAFDLHALSEFVWLTSDLIEFSEGDGKCQILVFHYGINLRFVRRFVKHFFLLLVVGCFIFATACVTRDCCCWLAPGAPRFAEFGHKKIPILMDGVGVLFVGILAKLAMMFSFKFQSLDHVFDGQA